MLMRMRRIVCCTRDREISVDFDEPQSVVTYNGPEVCIINNESYENDSRTRTSQGEGCLTDSYDDGASSCSSSKEILGSTSSKWVPGRQEDRDSDEWDPAESPQHSFTKHKAIYINRLSDIETMKEKFAKLLLGEDVTGGSNGLSIALALSNAITNLAATIFGELWKLEPLSDDKKGQWKGEMNWLVSPTKYMVELVPGKRSGTNGCMLEIMTPRSRVDICMNLPALQKLDSLLIETLDSMVSTEFWYMEGGSRAEGRNKSKRKSSKRWWLPSPQVPKTGLSNAGRKKLMNQARLVYQVLNAAKSINENVLAEMPVPVIIKEALLKAGKASLGEELFKALNLESSSVDDMFKLLDLQTEPRVLDCINKLEVASFTWKGRIHEQENGKSPSRTSWSFVKDPINELEKTEMLLDRAESLVRFLRAVYPNLPHSFLDATKVQYGKDVGHAILEGYSRVLGNLAFSILSRVQDVLQEDAAMSNPDSLPLTSTSLPGASSFFDILGRPIMVYPKVKHSHLHQPNGPDGKQSSKSSSTTNTSDSEVQGTDSKTSSVTTTTSSGRAWCSGIRTLPDPEINPTILVVGLHVLSEGALPNDWFWSAKFKCLGDAGFFINAKDVSGNQHIQAFYEEVVATHGLAKNLPASCTSQMNPGLCFFPQNAAQHIQTPLFLLNAAYDAWQIKNILAPGVADPHRTCHNCKTDIRKCSGDQLKIMQDFRLQFISAINELGRSATGGMFIDGCYAHCQSEMQETWLCGDSPILAKMTISKAVGDWY